MHRISVLPFLVSGVALIGVNQARADDLDERIAALEAKVDRLMRDDEWLARQRSAEIRELVRGCLDDTDARAGRLAGGHDGGIFIASEDGAFRMNIHGQSQVRFVYNYQDDANGNTTDANLAGFENRRTKIWVDGHVIDPTWTYKIKANFDVDGGEYLAQETFIGKKLGDLSIQAGQFKAPYLKEQLVSSMHQLAVDRSLVNKRSDPDFPIGVQISGGPDDWHWAAMYHNGLEVSRSPWNAYDTEFAFSARTEFKLAGDWQQFDRYTSRRGSETGVMIGAAVTYENQEYGAGPPLPNGVDNEIETLGYTFDGMYHGDGWHLSAAYVATRMDNGASGAAAIDTTPWGIIAQGSLFVTDDLELIARYEYGDGDDPAIEDLKLLTVGVNWYIAGDAIKWSTDLGYGFGPIDSYWALYTQGWRADLAGEDGQLVVRSQLQLAF